MKRFVKLGEQLFFGRQKHLILGGANLRVMFGKRKSDDRIVFIGAQQNSDGRILEILFFNAVEIIDIHLKLSEMLMRQLFDLYLEQYETLQKPIVKHQINVKIVAVEMYSFLPCDRSSCREVQLFLTASAI